MGQIRVSVSKFKPIENGGNLKAVCSVEIGDKLEIHGCRIVQQPEQLPWASLPQREWMDTEGKKRFYPVVELPYHVEHQIKKAILRAREEFEHAAA